MSAGREVGTIQGVAKAAPFFVTHRNARTEHDETRWTRPDTDGKVQR
jgi:hypothetical protein